MNQSQLRASFWEAFPQFAPHFRKGRRQNSYNATIRSAWVDYVDSCARDGSITEATADRVTL